jgi:hypothetical protein
VTYAPSSHAFVFVAFVLAERTLLIPSFGIALLMAEALAPSLAAAGGAAADAAARAEAAAEAAEAAAQAAEDANADSKPSPAAPAETAAAAAEAKAAAAVENSAVAAAAAARAAPGAASPAAFASTAAAAARSCTPPRASRRAGAAALLCLCLAYYGVRAHLRNLDWADEESLLRSNIALYPTGNGMSMYGLGAIRLYQGRLDEAEALLWRAVAETTLAEPHILLGQLFWKHRGNLSAAISSFERVERTSSPRKEMLQNLGLLLMATGRAPAENATARARAEYLVLAGHKAHGYPMGHPNIGALAGNAACVRTTSQPERYASTALAAELFEEALSYRHSSRHTAFKNAALFHAIQGRAERALQIAEAGAAYIEELRAQPNLAPDGHRQADDLVRSFRVIQLAVRTHAPLLAAWAEAGVPGLGAVADERLALIGGDCTMELLWW